MHSVVTRVIVGCLVSISFMPSVCASTTAESPNGAESSAKIALDEKQTGTDTMNGQGSSSTAQQESEPQQTEFIDTIDIGAEGNWLYKRKWYEKAQVVYERVVDVVDGVLGLRMPFFVQRADLDKTVFDPFYLAVGLDSGELQEAVNTLIAKMNQERELQGALDKSELATLDLLQKEKTSVEQLQKDVDEVLQIDHDIDDALAELMKQIDKCRGWQKEAWSNFKAIAAELSDKKAEEFVYSMEAQEANVKGILGWIQGDFTTYFNERVKKAEEQTTRIKQSIELLQQKGIDLKSQVQRIDEQSEKERIDAATEKAAQEALEEAEQEAKEKRGFFGGVVATVKSAVVAVWDLIVYCCKAVYNGVARILGFGGSEDEAEEVEEETTTTIDTKSDGATQSTTSEETAEAVILDPASSGFAASAMPDFGTESGMDGAMAGQSSESNEPEPILAIDAIKTPASVESTGSTQECLNCLDKK